MDKMYAYICKAGKVTEQHIKAVSEYFNDEEFDTDGITQDIQDVSLNEKAKSNILQSIQLETLRKSTFDFIQQHTCMFYLLYY